MTESKRNKKSASEQPTVFRGKFTVLAELFGLRDLAADNPQKYANLVRNFGEQLSLVFEQRQLSLGNCLQVLDRCIFFSDDPVKLFEIAGDLRRELLTADEPVPFRAILLATDGIEISVVSQEQVEKSKKGTFRSKGDTQENQPFTPGIHFNGTACELFGRLESFKGVGLWVDQSFLDCATDAAKSEKERTGVATMRKRCFQNYFLPSTREARYAPFQDIILGEEDRVEKASSNLIYVMRDVYHRSPKAARFLVPLLTNWMRHTNLKTPWKDNHLGLEGHMALTELRFLYRINGASIIMFALIQRLYPEKEALKSGVENVRWKMLDDFLVNKCKWAIEELRDDEKKTRVPPDILNRIQRRAFLEHVAKR